MRFELTADWPIAFGQVIPAGTVLSSSISDGAYRWNGQMMNVPLPADAKPLDREAAEQMAVWHPAR